VFTSINYLKVAVVINHSRYRLCP